PHAHLDLLVAEAQPARLVGVRPDVPQLGEHTEDQLAQVRDLAATARLGTDLELCSSASEQRVAEASTDSQVGGGLAALHVARGLAPAARDELETGVTQERAGQPLRERRAVLVHERQLER